MRLLRSHGMTTLTWDRHRGHASGYDVVALGFNYRIDEPRAALATPRLARLDAENARRARLVAALPRGARGGAGRDARAAPSRRTPSSPTTSSPSCSTRASTAKRFRAALHERGVQTSLHYPPVHRFSIYAGGAPSCR